MARITVKVVPKAAKNKIVGWLGDAIKLTVRAAPEKGQANEAVAALLSEALEVSNSAVTLVAGAASPRKVFEVEGLSESAVRERVDAWLGLQQ